MPLGIILAFEMSSATFSPGEVITDTWLHPLPNLHFNGSPPVLPSVKSIENSQESGFADVHRSSL